MKDSTCHIIVFEHEWIRTDKLNYRGIKLPQTCYHALCSYYGDKGSAYFELIYNGVKFREFVGVIQTGRYIIEILPKADKSSGQGEENKWQRVLIQMLKQSGEFPVEAPSSSALNLQQNSILDLYIRLFLDQTSKLIHEGLIKKYRRTEGNLNALKGRLMFNKQLQRNLIHAEHFYTSFTNYNHDHVYNQVIFKALDLISRISASGLAAEAKQLQLHFPEMTDFNVSEKTFQNLKIDRKTERYRSLISIARLLLLNYHPDVSRGRNHVLALMFDMNSLWEKYVLTCLKKASLKHRNVIVNGQESQEFWNGRNIRPDIVLRLESATYIIDTKWKALDKPEPSVEDVRQMYAYNHHFKCNKSILLYPNVFNIAGIYSDYRLPNLHIPENEVHGCGILFANIVNRENQLNSNFGSEILMEIVAQAK